MPQRLRGRDPSPHLAIGLSRADLRRIVRAPIDADAPVVTSLDLRGAKLDSVCLADARLHYAQLDQADLSFAELPGADLTSSSMVGARLRFAILPNANLTFVNLRCAKLGEADLRGADFSKASLEWAFLGGAKLKGIKHLDDVVSMDSAFVAFADSLSEADRQVARSKGAYVDRQDQIEWTEGAKRQMEPGAICTLPPTAKRDRTGQ